MVPRQVFRSGFWRAVAVGWSAFVLFNVWDTARRGFPDNGVVALLILGAITMIVYVLGWRPAVVADGQGVEIRNPARTIHLPWNEVTEIDATDALRIHDRNRIYRSWAVSRGGAVASVFRGTGRKNQGGHGMEAQALAAMARQSPADYAAVTLTDIWRQARGRTKGSVRVTWAWPEAVAFVAFVVAIVVASSRLS